MSCAVSRRPRRLHDTTHIHIVVELDAPRAVELDLLQGLAHDIIRLVLRLLRGLDDGALVEVALVVEVELAEGVLQPENLALLELRVFPASLAVHSKKKKMAGHPLLQLDDVHNGGIGSPRWWGARRRREARKCRQRVGLAPPRCLRGRLVFGVG
jgi:hypothetical protein